MSVSQLTSICTAFVLGLVLGAIGAIVLYCPRKECQELVHRLNHASEGATDGEPSRNS